MLADFSIAPLDKGDKNLGKHVAGVIEIIKASGLAYNLHSMGTTVEGETVEVFELLKRCHLHMKGYSSRVYTVIKIDDRENSTGRLGGKVDSVKKHLK